MRSLPHLVATCALLSLLPGSAMPQTATLAPAAIAHGQDDTWTLPDRNLVNEGTVTIVTAPAGGASALFGSDMARVLDDGDNLRVLPVLGRGPVQNVVDVLLLKSIDMGLVAADVPEFYKLQYRIPDIASRLRYIAKLYNNELHVIAPTSIKSIFDLEGKNIEAQTDVGYYSAKVIFSRLNIHANFDFRSDDTLAIQKVIDGKADAYITSTGKIFGLARNIKNEDRRLHLVPIPYDQRLQDLYLPTTLSGQEYPNLLAPGEVIDTVATSVLLVSFNWPEHTERYNRVARFVDALFSKMDEFYSPPRHPKWHESSINIDVPGWQRFKAAQDWLDQHGAGGAMDASQVSSADFQQFLAATGVARRHKLSEADMVKLYGQFLEWSRTRK